MDDIPNGPGVMHYENGDKFEGFWKGGVKSGIGRIDFAIGDKYIGNF